MLPLVEPFIFITMNSLRTFLGSRPVFRRCGRWSGRGGCAEAGAGLEIERRGRQGRPRRSRSRVRWWSSIFGRRGVRRAGGEIPGYIELQKKYGKDGLVIIGVSLDQKGPSVVKPFVAKIGINYPIVMGDDDIASAFGGMDAIPDHVHHRSGRHHP